METIAVINDVFNQLLNREVVLTKETTPQDIEGWDSLFQANLIEALEKKYGVRFKLREILSWDNVGNIVESINNHIG